MRRRSLAGPLLLLLIGGLFLWINLHPEARIFDTIARYWPFVLIGWGLLRLGEALLWRRQGVAGFSGGEIVLIVLICIAGSALWQAHEHGIRFYGGGLDVFGDQFDYQVSAKAPATGMTRITFENSRGNIKITGADTNEVTVTGQKVLRAWSRQDADRTSQNTPLEIVPQGDRLLIRSNQDRVPENQRISDDLEVVVPRGVTIEARGRTGDFEVSDVTGDVELATDRADVRLSRVGGNARLDIGRSRMVRIIDLKGRVDLQGRGSDVELENIEGQVTINGGYDGTLEFKNLAKPLQFEGTRNTELRVQGVPGRISMNLGQVSASGLIGPVRLITRSRDIRLEQFTESLELETQRGDVELVPGRLPMPAIQVRSAVGRIELAIPEKANFNLEATAEHGDAVNDFGAPIERDQDGRTVTLKGKVGEGPTLRLTAGRGMVSVRKQSTGDIAPMTETPAEKPKTVKKPKATEI